MNHDILDPLSMLRNVDPAAGQHTAMTVDDLIAMAPRRFGGRPATSVVAPRRARRTGRIMALVGAIAAAVIGVTIYPPTGWFSSGSSAGEGNVAYGISTSPGRVTIDLKWSKVQGPAEFQQALRDAGLTGAVVLEQSVTCTEPLPDGLPAIADVLVLDTRDDQINYDAHMAGRFRQTFKTSALPAGQFLLFTVPADNLGGALTFSVADKIPQCVPEQGSERTR